MSSTDFQLPAPPAPTSIDEQASAPAAVTFGTWALPDWTLPIPMPGVSYVFVNNTVTVSAQWKPVVSVSVSESTSYSHSVSVTTGTEVTNSESVTVDASAGFDYVVSLGASISKTIGYSVTVTEAQTTQDTFSTNGNGQPLNLFVWQAVYTYTVSSVMQVWMGDTLAMSVPTPPFHLVDYGAVFNTKQYPSS